jgi:hypothetical protein
MNFLAAILLLQMKDEEATFWTLAGNAALIAGNRALIFR